MKVLLSAFACRPGRGSEPHVGWRIMLAAAERHDVWLLTNDAAHEDVRRGLAAEHLSAKVHLVPVGTGFDDTVPCRGGSLEYHYRYDRWQRMAGRTATILDRQVEFDAVHHATLAAYWARAGVSVLERPLVWGPVGGGVNAPRSLLPVLGARGIVNDGIRFAARRVLERLPPSKQVRDRAALVLAQNPSTAARLRSVREVRILSNAWSVGDLETALQSAARQRTTDVVFAGRLIPWKGAVLAVQAFARVRTPRTTLHMFGEGPEEARVRRLAARLGVGDRVVIHGSVPRERLLPQVASAGVLLHTALHEESGLAVAEALKLGTPVVCLAHGGPHVLVTRWPSPTAVAVPPSTMNRTAAALATAVEDCLKAAPPIPATPLDSDVTFAVELLDAYQRAAEFGAVTQRWAS